MALSNTHLHAHRMRAEAIKSAPHAAELDRVLGIVHAAASEQGRRTVGVPMIDGAPDVSKSLAEMGYAVEHRTDKAGTVYHIGF